MRPLAKRCESGNCRPLKLAPLGVYIVGSVVMRIFKNPWFARFAKKEAIADELLCEAVERAENDRIDADLGGGVIKQRVAKPQKGKSKGWRVIVAFQKSKAAFFLFGFPKSSRDDIDEKELKVFKMAAKELLKLTNKKLDKLIETGKLSEVSYGKEKVSK